MGMMNLTAIRSTFLIALLLVNLFSLPAKAQQAPPKLNIVIIEGEGAINNVKQRVNREPIVQVEDENHKPVAGAAVVFFLPNQGPGGVFGNGTRTLTTLTDNQGRATASGIRPNNQTGSMQIRVSASFAGQTATAVITQTNAAGAAAAAGMSLTMKMLIIGAIAGGAAAGAIVATHGGGGSANTSGTATITPGTPTVGAPQ